MSSTSLLADKKMVLSTLLETGYHDSLIKELTCTKCKKYAKPPIHLCTNGHSLCGPCFEECTLCRICHVCSKEVTNIRSTALESLANKALFPCTSLGCSIHAVLPQLEKHYQYCQFRIVDCYMSKVYEFCNWKGRAGDWVGHCCLKHSDKVFNLPYITVRNRWDANRKEPVLNYFIMKCYDNFFYVHQIYDKKGGRIIWTVIVNGEHADEFYFEVDIFHPKFPHKRIVSRRPCRQEKDADSQEQMQSIYVAVETVLVMLDEDKCVNFIVKIGENESLQLSDSSSKF